jgi:hypothetical protein
MNFNHRCKCHSPVTAVKCLLQKYLFQCRCSCQSLPEDFYALAILILEKSNIKLSRCKYMFICRHRCFLLSFSLLLENHSIFVNGEEFVRNKYSSITSRKMGASGTVVSLKICIFSYCYIHYNFMYQIIMPALILNMRQLGKTY